MSHLLLRKNKAHGVVDEAEGFLLEHALISPPRTWPPLPTTQADRIAQGRRKMDWEGEVRDNPDDPDLLQGHAHAHGHGSGDEDENKERCVICLMALRDRTIVGVCGHEFCVSRSLTFLFCLVCVTRKVELTASLNVLGYGQINLVNAHYVQPKWPLSCYTTWIVVSQQRFVHPHTYPVYSGK